MTRDYIAEALAIAEGRSIMLPQRQHLDALYGMLQGFMTSMEWEALHFGHEYPQVEPEAEFERRTRG